jgi:hypothetical protein
MLKNRQLAMLAIMPLMMCTRFLIQRTKCICHFWKRTADSFWEHQNSHSLKISSKPDNVNPKFSFFSQFFVKQNGRHFCQVMDFGFWNKTAKRYIYFAIMRKVGTKNNSYKNSAFQIIWSFQTWNLIFI